MIKISIHYVGEHRVDCDKKLADLAQAHHGRNPREGDVLQNDNTRDMQFEFPTIEDAKAFEEHLPLWAEFHKI